MRACWLTIAAVALLQHSVQLPLQTGAARQDRIELNSSGQMVSPNGVKINLNSVLESKPQ
jgi:hypothetical protein